MRPGMTGGGRVAGNEDPIMGEPLKSGNRDQGRGHSVPSRYVSVGPVSTEYGVGVLRRYSRQSWQRECAL